MAKPIDLLFGLWTPVGLRKHKFNRIYQVAHLRRLANRIEPSISGVDAVLCHITLTTCYQLTDNWFTALIIYIFNVL